MNEQIPLAMLSLCAIACVTSKSEKVRKYGPYFGLASQPFWLYATWKAGQMGMFSLSFVYTLMWIRGIYNARKL